MLCDRCHKRDAKILYTEIINGVKKEQHLCEECATDYTSFQMEKPLLNSDLTLGDLLSTLLGGYSDDEKRKAIRSITCSNCGTTYDEFLRMGRFGCYKCYKSFDTDGRLARTLKGIQGAENHTGKRPTGYVAESADQNIKDFTEIEKLTMKLQEAIEKEEFEEAARLRDLIKMKREEEASNA